MRFLIIIVFSNWTSFYSFCSCFCYVIFSLNFLFLSNTNQNDYAIIHNIKLTQQNITIPWKLTNPEILDKYRPNTISKGIIGDLCASNGLGIVIIDREFSTPVTGNKHDGWSFLTIFINFKLM